MIVNTGGALTGVALVAAARRRLGARLPVIATWILVALTVLAFLVIGVRIATFPQIPPGTVMIR